MTFAIVRKGRVVDCREVGTLEELAAWFDGRAEPDEVVLVHLGEEVRVGDRVVVRDVTVGLAERAPVRAVR